MNTDKRENMFFQRKTQQAIDKQRIVERELTIHGRETLHPWADRLLRALSWLGTTRTHRSLPSHRSILFAARLLHPQSSPGQRGAFLPAQLQLSKPRTIKREEEVRELRELLDCEYIISNEKITGIYL